MLNYCNTETLLQVVTSISFPMSNFGAFRIFTLRMKTFCKGKMLEVAFSISFPNDLRDELGHELFKITRWSLVTHDFGHLPSNLQNINGINVTRHSRQAKRVSSLFINISPELLPVWFGLPEHSKCASLDWAASWWTQYRTAAACSYQWSWHRHEPR